VLAALRSPVPLPLWAGVGDLRPCRSTSHPDVTLGLTWCRRLLRVLGFGYILPATFLPALAREVVDDPHVFGLAWPVFGVAAALSTIATARRFGHANRLRVWAVSHLLMPPGHPAQRVARP